MLHYVFRKDGDPDPALVAQLMGAELNVSLPVAQELARDYPAHIERALAFVQHRRAVAGSSSPVRNPVGLLRSVLKDPDRYLLTDFPESPNPNGRTQRTLRRQGHEREQLAVQQRFEAQKAALEQASPQEQWRDCRASLKLLLNKHLSSSQWNVLEHRCQAGQTSASALLHTASQAAANLELTQFVDDLKADLSA